MCCEPENLKARLLRVQLMPSARTRSKYSETRIELPNLQGLNQERSQQRNPANKIAYSSFTPLISTHAPQQPRALRRHFHGVMISASKELF